MDEMNSFDSPFGLDGAPILLAQTTPPAPDQPITATGADGAADGTGAGGGAAPASPFGGPFLPIMILMLGGLIVFSIFGQRRERKKREAMISAVKKHDRVQTIGGVIGSVVDVKSDEVVLKVDESSNTRITFARSAVQQVVSSGKEPDPS